MLQTPLPQPNTTEERETPKQAKPVTRMARFLLEYDYSKARGSGMTRFQKHQAEGVQFSEGKIALDFKNGNTGGYGSFREMQQALSRQGKFDVKWID